MPTSDKPSMPCGESGKVSTETIYKELCTSYRGIDDFRAKLLGALPLATGAGILFTAKEVPSLLQHTRPIALFGILITLGLFCYEIYGITKCAELILAGKKIELAENVQGQFASRPQAVFGWFNEPFAAGIIYPAVLASWTVMWNLRSGKCGLEPLSSHAKLTAVLVFAGGLAATVAYDRFIDWECKKALKGWLKDHGRKDSE